MSLLTCVNVLQCENSFQHLCNASVSVDEGSAHLSLVPSLDVSWCHANASK